MSTLQIRHANARFERPMIIGAGLTRIYRTHLKWVLILFLLAGAMGLPVSVVLGQGGTVNVSAQIVSIPGGTYTIGTDRARARV
ncbi:hypothetical protein, partial [Candidatus Entotheonella palauensis]|uniref:hypothetical protein n=1 Tax=Candidatus Entotheonella palauensis TaxID=93172 RepID=UPI001C4E12C5